MPGRPMTVTENEQLVARHVDQGGGFFEKVSHYHMRVLVYLSSARTEAVVACVCC